MKIMDNLTEEQIDVLFEFVESVKTAPRDRKPQIRQMLYDTVHGDDEALELLNLCFYDLIKIENLSREEIRELAILLSEREQVFKIEPDNIFEPEKECLNETRAENRKKHKTNGQEYL